jgi:PleD family two-component response regulator
MNDIKNSVLIVDDDISNLEILLEILGKDYTVYVSKSGKAAIDIANNNLPDLILLDVVMPDMDGFDVLTKLKTSDRTHEIPIIIITGLKSVEDEERGFELGAVDIIQKPFDYRVVKARSKNQIQIVNRQRSKCAACEHYLGNRE